MTFALTQPGLRWAATRPQSPSDLLGADAADITVTVNVLDPDTAEPDDVLPGIAAPSSPFQGSVDPVTDKRDIYHFHLDEGQFLHVEVAQTTEATAVAALFGPGTTDVTDPSAAPWSGEVSQQTSFTADVTANGGEAGDYYLSVAAGRGRPPTR